MTTHPVRLDLDLDSTTHPADAQGPVEAIWMAAARPRWHVPVLAGQDTAMPYLVLEQDEPVALMFSTRRRAVRAIDGWITDVVDHDVHAATIDAETTLDVLMRLHARGLQWIRIDHGPSSVKLPLEPLVGGMQRVQDTVVDASPEESTWRWMAAQDHVLMLRDAAARDLPLIEILDEQPTVRVFMHRGRALARAAQLAIPVRDRNTALLSMNGEEAVERLRRLAQLGVDQVIVEQPGGMRVLALTSLLKEARRAA